MVMHDTVEEDRQGLTNLLTKETRTRNRKKKNSTFNLACMNMSWGGFLLSFVNANYEREETEHKDTVFHPWLGRDRRRKSLHPIPVCVYMP